MKEIRSIRAAESEEFLKVLCQIFDLNYQQALHVYFNEPMYDLNRKWAYFIDGKMVSILTTSPLNFGWGKAIGIAGVGTIEPYLGQGIATELLQAALDKSERDGEGAAILFAHQTGLYARSGFEVMDHVIRGQIIGDSAAPIEDCLSHEEVRACYSAWSAKDPNRLIRDARRWKCWEWTLKDCEPFAGGYICMEPMGIREAILGRPSGIWPVPRAMTWYGLRSLTSLLDVPLKTEKEELILMGRGFPDIPQMFMTDQF